MMLMIVANVVAVDVVVMTSSSPRRQTLFSPHTLLQGGSCPVVPNPPTPQPIQFLSRPTTRAFNISPHLPTHALYSHHYVSQSIRSPADPCLTLISLYFFVCSCSCSVLSFLYCYDCIIKFVV
ncbi:unnamed protein product [Cylicocyclus nassatus]|uniref:Uncharacterized protein n=1 Tax=Cylicocyclus nassatus TaxID=53992 RepID=A0AA36HB08_CYLNA|nr:unnamed protein product [Cylicocyclus nassatus]